MRKFGNIVQQNRDRGLWNLPTAPDLAAEGYTGVQQDRHVEIWVEKTTMNDVLIPLCRKYGVNLITGAGELSITAVVNFLDRVRKADRPARILYVSDFDPSGLGMPVSIARKIEYFLRDSNGLDIRLQPIALNSDQVAQYDLPRTPVKDSDRRKATWQATQGAGAVELDALEALHPGSLAGMVEETILQYYDTDLSRRARIALAELKALLRNERAEVIDTYGDDLDSLQNDYDDLRDEWGATQQEFDKLVQPFSDEIERHRESLQDITERTKSLYAEITEDLENVEIDVPEVPGPDLPQEDDSTLYASERDYFDQLASYKKHRNGRR